MHPALDKNGQPIGPVEAPVPIQQAKNLVEEFFGLAVTDGHYMPAGMVNGGSYGHLHRYECALVSPTGRAVGGFELRIDTLEGRVIYASRNLGWEQALQMAIDDFVNNPTSPTGLAGWKPDPAKLLSGR
jgi:hypothetical protein